jgi:imidazolonepropionase-like amidohydrolase
VTTVVTAPRSGIFNGQSAVLNLAGGSNDSRVLKSPAAMQVSFAPRPAWTFPDSLMGVIAFVRQSLLDARQHAAARAIYDKSPAGNRRPDDSEALDALAPVVRGDLPLVFIADTELAARRAAAIAKEMNVKLILSGSRQAYRMPDDLRQLGAPVLVSVKWPTAPVDRDEREDQPLRVIRDRQLAPTGPAALAKSNVVFALVSGPSADAGDFLKGIRKAIDNGLGADDALRAVTLSPARIFGVDRQLGSLERGKIANVMISDKAIFAKDAKVKRLFVDGREVRLPEAKKSGGTAAGGIDGAWTFSVQTSEEAVSIAATLKVESGEVSGTFSSNRGSGDIAGGSFDGKTLEMTIAMQTKAETSDWVFHGTLDGGSITGTVSTNTGTFKFSGSKSK